MRAVLAEDHPAMAQQLRALISSDCDVRIVQDAQMPDIVIADITMPGNSGGRRPGTSSPRLRKLAKSARTPQKSDGREWWTEHA
jgi:DNA-binding NarL/FixJ family response regulator